ncbi:HP1 family phage holin [Photobacterium atrarenae]|uniref:Phage holin family protein n=1 Tax=Photobacterium atrarenae TaxID=865757 RepID=A0ABY5GKL9_9GAMM|nr:HP1 family phage holin [Photobacterium atrarenae]UTV29259.1 phage holin family protein [Photobacterium atrarenae]
MQDEMKSMLKRVAVWWSAFPVTVRAEEISTGSTRFWAGWSTFFSLFTVQEWGVLVGIVLGVLSFVLSWYYKHKNHELLKHSMERERRVVNEVEQP